MSRLPDIQDTLKYSAQFLVGVRSGNRTFHDYFKYLLDWHNGYKDYLKESYDPSKLCNDISEKLNNQHMNNGFSKKLKSAAQSVGLYNIDPYEHYQMLKSHIFFLIQNEDINMGPLERILELGDKIDQRVSESSLTPSSGTYRMNKCIFHYVPISKAA